MKITLHVATATALAKLDSLLSLSWPSVSEVTSWLKKRATLVFHGGA